MKRFAIKRRAVEFPLIPVKSLLATERLTGIDMLTFKAGGFRVTAEGQALVEAKISYEVFNHPLAFTAQEIAAKQHVSGREIARVVVLSGLLIKASPHS